MRWRRTAIHCGGWRRRAQPRGGLENNNTIEKAQRRGGELSKRPCSFCPCASPSSPSLIDLPSAACAGPCCCRVVCFPVVSLHCDCFSLETSSVFSRLLVLCILPYHCRLCEWKNPLCNTSATSIRRKVYVSGHAPKAPTAHRRRQFGMAAKRAGAARRWKNKTKCTRSPHA